MKTKLTAMMTKKTVAKDVCNSLRDGEIILILFCYYQYCGFNNTTYVKVIGLQMLSQTNVKIFPLAVTMSSKTAV